MHSDASKELSRQSHLGQPAWNKGLKMSDETRLKQSLIKLGKPSNFVGKKHSKESIEKRTATRKLNKENKLKGLL